jgi:UDP-galactopyranose mutase
VTVSWRRVTQTAWIVGGGLAGATVSWALRERGIRPVVFEQAEVTGGLIRAERLNGVIYEPHGTHAFHTDDEEVWRLVGSLVPFRPYEHRVLTMIEGRLVHWPIMREDLEQLSFGPRALEHVDAGSSMPTDPGELNFEEWCLRLMGHDIYEHYVKPYTEKQWGRPPAELAADFAPKRVQVRTDGDDRLFKDRFQGFPDGSLEATYTDLVDGFFGHTEIHTGTYVTLAGLLQRVETADARPDYVVVTAPLDDFAEGELGTLDWRGLRFEHTYIPDVDFAQEREQVNWPGKEFAWIRTHETKHASGQQVAGTVLTYEFTGAPARYYPVPGVGGAARRLNDAYQQLIRARVEEAGPRILFAGRLANFMYYDMDDVIRQALDLVRSLPD